MLMLQENIENNVVIDSLTEISYRNSKTLRLNKELPSFSEEMLDIKVCAYH